MHVLRSLSLIICISFLIAACGSSSDGKGGCTVDCSDLGSSINIKNYRFISEDECRAHADAETAKKFSCKVWYCPPTGNEDDCYRVYLDQDVSSIGGRSTHFIDLISYGAEYNKNWSLVPLK